MRNGYKRTGVLTVDKVSACIDHYAKAKTPLSSVTLDKQHWNIYKEYALSIAPDCVNEDESIDFNGVLIRLGSTLMVKAMDWDFKIKSEA